MFALYDRSITKMQSVGVALIAKPKFNIFRWHFCFVKKDDGPNVS
jgi:hypothetical protein